MAQAIATGYVGGAAQEDRASAGCIYLTSYFSGGLVSTAILGQAFDWFGWTACIVGVAVALLLAAVLALRPREM